MQMAHPEVTHLSRRLISVKRNSIISSCPAKKKINRQDGDAIVLLLWLPFIPSMELLIAKVPHSAS